jgi:hypothetical protein
MRTAFEELATEAEAAAGKVLAEKAEAEKVLAKKVLAEKAAAEKAATEKEATEKAAVEKVATEKAATENAAAVSRAVLKKQIGDTVGDTDDDTGTPGPPSPAPLWRGRGKVSSVARNATTPLTAEDSDEGEGHCKATANKKNLASLELTEKDLAAKKLRSQAKKLIAKERKDKAAATNVNGVWPKPLPLDQFEFKTMLGETGDTKRSLLSLVCGYHEFMRRRFVTAKSRPDFARLVCAVQSDCKFRCQIGYAATKGERLAFCNDLLIHIALFSLLSIIQ